jgi:hypothetical protein
VAREAFRIMFELVTSSYECYDIADIAGSQCVDFQWQSDKVVKESPSLSFCPHYRSIAVSLQSDTKRPNKLYWTG